VRYVGLSEVGVDTIRRAHRTHPMVDLQIEYSILSRDPEENIFPVLEELGISATLYSVLGRGLLGGSRPGPRDTRNFFPRYSAENRGTNEPLLEAFATFASEKGMSRGQLAVAWVLAKEPRLVPVIGARTAQQVDDVLGALEKPLSPSDVERLEALVPKGAVGGTRYPAAAMASLDSER
jgi:aryl-alcohol dehydrogenase-like predicted oxidoreductase